MQKYKKNRTKKHKRHEIYTEKDKKPAAILSCCNLKLLPIKKRVTSFLI